MGIYKAGKPFTLLQDGAIDSYTKLLIHSNTSDGSTTFTDSSATGHTISTSGDPSHEDTTAKFGATSIYLDGSDYLDIASHADFNMGTGDFTMDGWFNFSTIADNRGIMSIGTAINGSGTFGVRWSGTGLQVKGNGSTLANFGGITDHNMSTGEWHHLALQRRSGVTELFVDGRLLGSDSTSYTLTQHNVRLGHYYESPYFGHHYIDEFRISKGIARWTETFSPPSSPYPTFSTYNIDSVGDDISNKDIIFPSNPSEDPTDIIFGVSSNVGAPLLDVYGDGSVGVGAPDKPTSKFEVQTGEPSGSKFSVSSGNDSYTKLLIHSDTVSGSTAFVDSSANSHVITPYGNVTHSLDQKKFGDTSMYFGGTSTDYLSVPDNPDWVFGTGDFTVDFWVRFPVAPDVNDIMIQYYKQSGPVFGNEWSIGIGTNAVTFHAATADTVLANYSSTWVGGSITTNTWFHVAVVRNGSSFYMFINGVQGTLTTTVAIGFSSLGSYEAPLTIGRGFYSNRMLRGYLDEIRISKGIARWTSNFDAPTRPHSHALTVDGPKGKLYTVTDSMETHGSGSLFSVNTTGGLPVIEAKDDYTTHLRGNLSLREPFTTPTTTGNETKIYTKKDTKPDSLTTLLIHSDSTDGSTDFVDSSVGHLISRGGDTQHSTVRSKFGKSSVYFDGSDQLNFGNLNHSDFNFGTGAFTIDLWINPTNAAAAQQPFAVKHFNDGNCWIWGIDGSDIEMYHRTGYGGYTQVFSGAHGMSSGIWYHLALVRESATSWKTYVNGVQKATSSTNVNLDIGAAQFRMGWTDNEWGASGNGYYTGFLEEYRVSKGIARWTAAFTPPTSPYETDANTALLIHSDTGNEDTHFIDSSETTSTRKAITAAGTAHHESDQYKFGGTSMHFDGTDDYLTIPYHTDFSAGNGDWTLDCWVWIEDFSAYRPIAHFGNNAWADTFWALVPIGTNQIRQILRHSGSDIINSYSANNVFNTETWHHVAWVYDYSELTFTVYIDGINIDRATSIAGWNVTDTTGLKIGRWQSATHEMKGYIDEFRISKGIARWTSNFDPPKRRYPLNEDKLLIKSDDGVEKTVIAAEPHGVVRQGQVLKATGEDGVQWQNNSVELFYQAQSMYAINLDLRNLQSVGNWIMAANMEVGNNFVVGKAPAGFIRVTAIKIGVFNVQGQFANQGVRMKWEIASDGQGYQTHTQGITTVRTFPGTDTAANTIFEADAFNLTGTNDFEDIISPGDYFGMAFDDLVGHNSAVLGVGITWEF